MSVAYLAAPTSLPYNERPEWADVTPISQDDGPAPVCAINYTAKFIDVMGYFRAILQMNELSQRAWDVTTDAIEANSGNYTAWHYRRLLIDALGKDIRMEFEFMIEIGGDNPKNYQIWHHRRVMVERIGAAAVADELAATATIILEGDNKNYHAWAHRQWILRTFNAYDGELKFIDQLLEADIRNNSAWNQRWFVVKNTDTLTPAVRVREIQFALTHSITAPHNPSPWNYIKGLLSGQTIDESFAPIIDTCVSLSSAASPSSGCLSTLVDIYKMQGTEESKNAARGLCHRLATEIDTIRERYWLARQNAI